MGTDSTPHQRFDLVAFDIDGTLIRSPNGYTVWEILNERFTGTAEHNRERYAKFKAGELSYADWVALDVRGWQDAGALRDDIVREFQPLSLIDGARETLGQLKQSGMRLVVISGTLDIMLLTLFPDHPFDEIHANHIGFNADGSISHWQATPFDMSGKATALRSIAMREGVKLDRCAYVGDSGNDLWVAQTAGFSIALNPNSDELEKAASVVVRSDDLRAILPHLLDSDGITPETAR